MNIRTILYFSLHISWLSLSVFSCKDKSNIAWHQINKTVYIKEIFEDNRLLSEQQFMKINDSFIANGYAKEYYSNGKVKRFDNYKNGHRDSVCCSYYENGQTDEIIQYHSGKPIGLQTKYYNSGETAMILINNGISEPSFKMKLNKQGNVTEISGSSIYISANKIHYQLNDTFFIIHIIPKSHDVSCELTIKVTAPSGKIIMDEKITEFIKLWTDYSYVLNGTFGQNGKYLYNVKTRLKNVHGKEICSDSIIDTFFVE